MIDGISSHILEKWLRARTLSRQLPLPTKFKSGFKVDVGYENQKARYVFAELGKDFIHLAKTIEEAWVYLKVCAAPEDFINLISDQWVIQPQGYMMNCSSPMIIQKITLPDNYKVDVKNYNSTTLIKVLTQEGNWHR